MPRHPDLRLAVRIMATLTTALCLLHVEYLDLVLDLDHLDLLLEVTTQQVVELPVRGRVRVRVGVRVGVGVGISSPEVDRPAAVLVERVEELVHRSGRHLVSIT